jgi:hypothetical protein
MLSTGRLEDRLHGLGGTDEMRPYVDIDIMWTWEGKGPFYRAFPTGMSP